MALSLNCAAAFHTIVTWAAGERRLYSAGQSGIPDDCRSQKFHFKPISRPHQQVSRGEPLMREQTKTRILSSRQVCARCDTPQGSLSPAPHLSATHLASRDARSSTPGPAPLQRHKLPSKDSHSGPFYLTFFPIKKSNHTRQRPRCSGSALLTMRFGLLHSSFCVTRGLIRGEIFLWLCF